MMHKISPEDLTLEQIGRILKNNIKLSLSDESGELIKVCRDYLDRKLLRLTLPLFMELQQVLVLCIKKQ